MPRTKPPLAGDACIAGSNRDAPLGAPVKASTASHREQSASQLKASPSVWNRSGLPSLLTVKAVAAGLDLSEKTNRRWFKAGQLPHHRAGRQIRIAEDDPRAFLARAPPG
jgi:excisionase family DNA binding protein